MGLTGLKSRCPQAAFFLEAQEENVSCPLGGSIFSDSWPHHPHLCFHHPISLLTLTLLPLPPLTPLPLVSGPSDYSTQDHLPISASLTTSAKSYLPWKVPDRQVSGIRT